MGHWSLGYDQLNRLVTAENAEVLPANEGVQAWEDKAINQFVDSNIVMGPGRNGRPSGHFDNDEASRQCALGNRAACDGTK